ncbi:ABC transporter substrate-binding protein [Schaalia sp. ZJ405]|uniref:ABC transporter substrate-binding protein n=1 Tax=Schaalia sp. ZJ405 TaxID=2709403 RepID=UPI0013EBDA17|nr:ABC transporter substrate-binding protein [Schaalia sp. ZJ405]QPK82100.1 ABC transporter substrate-binding protein [Schaalia sp. ZJ405]
MRSSISFIQSIRGALLAGAAACVLVLASACTPGGAGALGPGDEGEQSGRSGRDSGASSVTIGLTYIPNVQFAPVYVADAKGMYANAGLDASIRHHGSDEGLFTALISGTEDVVVASADEALIARDQGLDVVSVGAYYHGYPATIIVPEDSSVKSLSDLRGKTIGIPGEFGSNWYATLAALEQAHLTREDVTIMSIGYTQQAALAQGQVDAVVGFTNNDLVQMERAGMKVRSIPLDADKTPLIAAALITRASFAKDHPDTVSAIVKATVQGTQAILDNPTTAIDATRTWDENLADPQQEETARAVLDATIPLWKDAEGKASAMQDLQRWASMGSFLASIPDLLTGTPDSEAAATNTFATR